MSKTEPIKKDLVIPSIKINNAYQDQPSGVLSSKMFANTPRNDMFVKAAKNVINTETEVGKNLDQVIKRNKIQRVIKNNYK